MAGGKSIDGRDTRPTEETFPFPLRDAHLHLPEHGEALSMADVSGCASLDSCLEAIARAALDAAPGAWVQARGARVQAWRERRFPTARELDHAADGSPVVLRSFDHHAICVSTRVLEKAGIDSATPDPAGGVIVREPSGTTPTGTLLESACAIVWRVMPEPTMEQRRGFVRAAAMDLARRGFVEVHDMFTQVWQVEILRSLEAADQLPISVRLYATREHFDGVQAALGRGAIERVRFCGLKMFADGTLNSRTAHMLDPFREAMPGHPCGTPLLSLERLRDGLRLARSAGLHAAVHAIGDGAVRTVLDAVEAEAPQTGTPHRVEHAQFVHPKDVDRFAELGVVVSMQPCHLLADIEAIQRFTPDRQDRVFALRSILDSFAKRGMDPAAWVWLGSDTPVVPPEPLDNVQAASRRRRAGDDSAVQVGPGQAITEHEAWGLMRAPAASGMS